jgi:hypothetical protein
MPSGIACFIAVRGGSGAIHFITFNVLNQSLGKELRDKGKEDRGK